MVLRTPGDADAGEGQKVLRDLLRLLNAFRLATASPSPCLPLLHLEVLLPQYLTVGHLLRQLQELDPGLPVRLAVNPDFPFAHYVGADIVVRDGVAFIADDGQEDYLSMGARVALAWA